MREFLLLAMPYALVFGAAFLLTALLTPLVREFHRKIGMVDRPSARRINERTIPRGGGVAILIGVFATYLTYHLLSGRPFVQGVSNATAYRMVILSFAIAAVGWFDDLLSLRPKVKLGWQLVIATAAWGWAGVGFHLLWPSLPGWANGLITVLWITAIVNAYNLIDGLDGLATGLALIAICGLAGSLFITQNPQIVLFHSAFAGGLAAFLIYNWNPASVFLGDAGSMFIGFTLATLPLVSQTSNSFVMSVGVPVMAMGVPFFDMTLAVVRRLLRRLTAANAGDAGIMRADVDHLHHRILRACGLNQRRAATVLYAIAIAVVLFGIAAEYSQSRASGVWLAAFAVIVALVIRDSYIEISEAGRLAKNVLSAEGKSRYRLMRFSAPVMLVFDLLALSFAFMLVLRSHNEATTLPVVKKYLMVRVVVSYLTLYAFRLHRTVWSRATFSNYLTLFYACGVGAVAGGLVIHYLPFFEDDGVVTYTVAYAVLSFCGLALVRFFYQLCRELFFSASRLSIMAGPNTVRVLVYGSGVRYRAFRHELVHAAESDLRVVVGILDDDPYLHGRYLGSVRVMGSLEDAPEIIRRERVAQVMIACQLTDERLRTAVRLFKSCGVKVMLFSLSETEM